MTLAGFRRHFLGKRLRTILLTMTCIEIGAIAFGGSKMSWVVNSTESLPLGIYVRADGPDLPVHRGDIVAFCPPPIAVSYEKRYITRRSLGLYCFDQGGSVYLKYVAAVAGDRVTLTEHGVSVNGGPDLPGSRPLRVAEGSVASPDEIHALPRQRRGTYVVPKGHVWAYTGQWYSFDSRYYGPIAPEHRMKPWLTFPLRKLPDIPPQVAKLQEAHS